MSVARSRSAATRSRAVAASAEWPRALRRLLALLLAGSVVAAAVLVLPGFILDPPEQPLVRSDAIIVISGDEQLARFREGVRLYTRGYGRFLLFSGAAQDSGPSNADVMRSLAQSEGIPASAILEDPNGENTWGNAVYTLQVLQQHHLTSAILVTSPYHVRRATETFDAAYQGSHIHLLTHAAPDSQWRKLSWWQRGLTRRLTASELAKLAYIAVTGRYE